MYRPRSVRFMAVVSLALLMVAGCGTDETADDGTNTTAPPETTTTAASNGTTAEETTTTTAAEPEVSFEGETIRFSVGTEAGSGADIHTRLVADYLSDYLPGNPDIVVENRQGGGGVIMHNYLYHQAANDGTEFAHWHSSLATSQLLRNEGVDYEARDFVYLGAVERAPAALVVHSDSPFETWEDLFDGEGPALIYGASSATSVNAIVASYIRWLGADINLIVGYGGSGERALGVERQEIHSSYLNLEQIKTGLEDGTLRALIRTGPADPLMEGVPTLQEVTEAVASLDDPEIRGVFNLVNAPLVVLPGFIAPPGTPPEIAEVLETALRSVHEDPGFQEAATTAGRPYAPWLAGEEHRELVISILETDPAVVEIFNSEITASQ